MATKDFINLKITAPATCKLRLKNTSTGIYKSIMIGPATRIDRGVIYHLDITRPNGKVITRCTTDNPDFLTLPLYTGPDVKTSRIILTTAMTSSDINLELTLNEKICKVKIVELETLLNYFEIDSTEESIAVDGTVTFRVTPKVALEKNTFQDYINREGWVITQAGISIQTSS